MNPQASTNSISFDNEIALPSGSFHSVPDFNRSTEEPCLQSLSQEVDALVSPLSNRKQFSISGRRARRSKYKAGAISKAIKEAEPEMIEKSIHLFDSKEKDKPTQEAVPPPPSVSIAPLVEDYRSHDTRSERVKKTDKKKGKKKTKPAVEVHSQNKTFLTTTDKKLSKETPAIVHVDPKCMVSPMSSPVIEVKKSVQMDKKKTETLAKKKSTSCKKKDSKQLSSEAIALPRSGKVGRRRTRSTQKLSVRETLDQMASLSKLSSSRISSFTEPSSTQTEELTSINTAKLDRVLDETATTVHEDMSFTSSFEDDEDDDDDDESFDFFTVMSAGSSESCDTETKPCAPESHESKEKELKLSFRFFHGANTDALATRDKEVNTKSVSRKNENSDRVELDDTLFDKVRFASDVTTFEYKRVKSKKLHYDDQDMARFRYEAFLDECEGNI